MTQTLAGQQAREPDCAPDRLHVERVLARYPEIDGEELAALKKWFRKDATAHDVALVASNEAIHTQYLRFRKEHVDRFSPRDIVTGLIMLAVGVLVFGSILYLAPS